MAGWHGLARLKSRGPAPILPPVGNRVRRIKFVTSAYQDAMMPSGPAFQHGGRDVLDFAESVLAELSEAYFHEAEGILGNLRQALAVVKGTIEGDIDNAIERAAFEARRVQIALKPGGFTIGGQIARELGELLPRAHKRLLERHPTVIAIIDSHGAAVSVAIRKRLIAPNKPIAAGLLANLTALRAALDALPADKPSSAAPALQAPVTQNAAQDGAKPGGLWDSIRKIAPFGR